ncbi:hypothetical protein FRC04_002865 [Tulasnella sp. 424]|nr:hypothetical protein FRC04_002865 [Tulasnella sp. 424]
MPAPPPRDDAPASPSKRKAEDRKDFIMLSPAPKRPFPVTPSRAAKFSGASASTVKGTDAMAIDGSPSGQSWKSDRKERPTTPTPTARSTRGSRAAGGSSAVSK